jgi:GH24 family phage-related lysozyme (muramidase)
VSDPVLVRRLMLDEGRVGRNTSGGFIHTAYPDPLSRLAVWLEQRTTPRRTLRSPDRPAGLSGAPWTIGYGNTGPLVHEGLEWTDAEAMAELARDVETYNALLARVLPWVMDLDPVRRRVLQNMHYNMGWDNPRTTKLEGLSGFVRTLEAVRSGDYERAAVGMAASLWAAQTGTRAKRLIAEMRTGVDVTSA